MLTVEKKSELLSGFATHPGDTGSAEVQVAILTERILQLSGHLKTHPQDHASRRGLLKMVGKRAGQLKYLNRLDHDRYQKLIERLGLRK